MYTALEFATAADFFLYTALDQFSAQYKFFSDATWFHYISRMQRTNHLLHDSHPDQEGTKGPLTGKHFFVYGWGNNAIHLLIFSFTHPPR